MYFQYIIYMRKCSNCCMIWPKTLNKKKEIQRPRNTDDKRTYLASTGIAAVILPRGLLQVDPIIRKFIVQVKTWTLLAQGVPGYALESLFDVQRLFRRGLEEGDVVFRLAPLLGALRGHGARFQVHFVAQEDEGEVFGLPGRRLD